MKVQYAPAGKGLFCSLQWISIRTNVLCSSASPHTCLHLSAVSLLCLWDTSACCVGGFDHSLCSFLPKSWSKSVSTPPVHLHPYTLPNILYCKPGIVLRIHSWLLALVPSRSSTNISPSFFHPSSDKGKGLLKSSRSLAGTKGRRTQL